MLRFWTFAVTAVFVVALCDTRTWAGVASGTVAAPATSGPPAAGETKSSIQGALGEYGDPAGLRAFLDSKGIDFTFTYIGEALGNTVGGVKRGASVEGQLDGQIDVDLAKLAGLDGAALYANFY
jgi:porin